MLYRIIKISTNLCRFLVLVVFVFFLYLLSNDNSTEYKSDDTTKIFSYMKQTDKKYILQWTNSTRAPFNFMRVGNSAFVQNKCKYTNCFVTNDTRYLDESQFDAVVFNGREFFNLTHDQLPKRRSPAQKYIFGAMESADNFPMCDSTYDSYFNWTWTYKIDSDFRWGYITIYDLDGNIVGPKMDMKWPRDLEPIGEHIKFKLSTKSKAAAWFVSHCSTKGKREIFMEKLQKELEAYGWTVDVYGYCGTFTCPKTEPYACFNIIQNNYYFYFALENSFSEDYVTEKLLLALNNYAVPIVYGSANYSRFLPPGSYLDGRALGPKKLAKLMSKIIGNRSLYYNFFRWRNHYEYKETSSTEDICKLCEMMNNEAKMKEVTVWRDFRTWWNGARYKTNCL